MCEGLAQVTSLEWGGRPILLKKNPAQSIEHHAASVRMSCALLSHLLYVCSW